MNRKELELKRNYLPNCTIGELKLQGKTILYTVEKPWLSNTPFESCVPPGEYEIKPYSSPKYPDNYSIENRNLGVSVHGHTTRTEILFHVANYVEDVVGCIAVGLMLMPDAWGVAYSAKGMDVLRATIGSELGWKLKILV